MGFSIGISGATGITGDVALRILTERKFPVDHLRLFASRRSAGQVISWQGNEYTIEALDDGNFEGLDLIISATSSAIAKQWAPKMVAAGAKVVDQSSAFRGDPNVPLVIPEINLGDLASNSGIVAGPNCTTAVAIMAIAPLQRAFGIESVVSSSYQAISGKGREGVAEFLEASASAVSQEAGLRGDASLNVASPVQFPHNSAFNLFPQCEEFREGSDTSTEEEKMQAEMRKIMHAPGLFVHATAVRVPVVVGHSVSLAVSLGSSASAAEVREAIARFPGVRVVDEPWKAQYPTPRQAAGIDEVLVGRIREIPFMKNGISLFASGDNLRKGNALNAIQVAEHWLGMA
ncbi:MAG: aspartate-semialdehyde dehydrogenase [Pseudomonadales bacterium]|nr:aspartate-semialdehyde dehydrogenase [Pseudomonadales bacterium]